MLFFRRYYCSLSLFIGGFFSIGLVFFGLVDSVIRFFVILKLVRYIYGYFREFKNNLLCYLFSIFIEEILVLSKFLRIWW